MLMNISAHTPVAVNIKDESFFKDLGTRVALARKERNITQVQLAATLGIAQQTLAGLFAANTCPGIAAPGRGAARAAQHHQGSNQTRTGAQAGPAHGAHQRAAQEAAEVRDADDRDRARAARSLNTRGTQ
jgi:hypothetical protein